LQARTNGKKWKIVKVINKEISQNKISHKNSLKIPFCFWKYQAVILGPMGPFAALPGVPV
jgi:hypothetical protein